MNKQPLIICDIDEVVLRYFCYLRNGLNGSAYSLKQDNFDLRVQATSSGDFVSQELSDQLCDKIIEVVIENQRPINAAIEHLNRLAVICDIVFLTNTREGFYKRRKTYLESIGLPFPILLNQGGKGKIVAQLIEGLRPAVTIVIDDSVRQLQNIRDRAPSAYLVRAMVTPETKQTKSNASYAEYETWAAIEAHIRRILRNFL